MKTIFPLSSRPRINSSTVLVYLIAFLIICTLWSSLSSSPQPPPPPPNNPNDSEQRLKLSAKGILNPNGFLRNGNESRFLDLTPPQVTFPDGISPVLGTPSSIPVKETRTPDKIRKRPPCRLLVPKNLSNQKPNSTLPGGMSWKTKNFYAVTLNRFRENITKEMTNYNYMEVRNTRNKSHLALKHLVMEQGGKPVRNLVVSTWRSGSRFLTELLGSHPGMFIEYEPFLHWDQHRIKSGSRADQAVQIMESAFFCNHTGIPIPDKFNKTYLHRLEFNPQMIKLCRRIVVTHLPRHLSWCKDVRFVERVCKLSPFLTMKTVRLNLRFVDAILRNKELDVRVLLLIRDPRGVMISREDESWCKKFADCMNVTRVCEDMVNDYEYADIFRKMYPDRFLILRYEDIMLNLEAATRKLFKLFRLQYHPKVQQFVDTFNNRSTLEFKVKVSTPKTAAFKWLKDVSRKPFRWISNIQDTCTDAMKLWGYPKLANKLELRNCTPVVAPPFPEMII